MNQSRPRPQPNALYIAAAIALGSAVPLAVSPPAHAQIAQRTQAGITLDLPAAPLRESLDRLARRAGVNIAFDPATVEGREAPALSGEFTLNGALEALLAGTDLTARESGGGYVVAPRGDSGLRLDPITVEATGDPVPPALDPVRGYKADFATTLTRVPTSRQETPASIGIVTSDFIEETGALSRDQALEQVAGVSRGGSIRGEQSITIRGFALPESALEINGVSVRDARPVDPAVVERIEVPRGPSSIIAGAGSPGGSVNIVTKRPQAERFTELRQDLGSYGLFRTIGDVNGPLTEDGRVRGRVVAVGTPDTGSFVDETESSEVTLAPSLDMDVFAGAATLRLTALYQAFDGNTFRGVPLMERGDAPDIDPETNVGGGDDNGAFNDFEGRTLQAEYDHEFLEGLTLNGRLGYQETDQEVADVYAFQFGGGIPDSGDINIYGSRRTLDKESLSGELFLTRTFRLGGRRHDLVIGGDYQDQKRDATLEFAGPSQDNIFDLDNDFVVPASGLTPFTDRTFELEQTGAFLQGVVRPTDALTVTGGVRRDNAEFSNRARVRNVDADVDESETTGRAGISLAILPALNAYASFQQSFNVQSALEADGQLVPPETGESIEAGAKMELFGGSLAVSAAVFRTDRQNVATADPDNPGFSIVTGEQRHEGFELEVNGELTPQVRLSAQLSVLDAEITEDPDFAGNTPPGVPRDYVGRVFGVYEPSSGPFAGWSLGGGVFFHSGFVIDSENDFKTDNYERIDLLAGYTAVENLDVRVNVRNVTDEEYIENPGTSSANNQFGAPRSVLASVRYRF